MSRFPSCLLASPLCTTAPSPLPSLRTDTSTTTPAARHLLSAASRASVLSMSVAAAVRGTPLPRACVTRNTSSDGRMRGGSAGPRCTSVTARSSSMVWLYNLAGAAARVGLKCRRTSRPTRLLLPLRDSCCGGGGGTTWPPRTTVPGFNGDATVPRLLPAARACC